MSSGLAINRLIALDLFPWVKVLDALEKALPDAVVIDSFRPDEGFARIHLAGHTDSLEQLVRFQERLEASDLFSAVVLENMGLGDDRNDNNNPNARSRMKFKLHCRLRLDRALPVETHGGLWRALEGASKKR
jgi:Tfp pilus assembly protein PilN